VAYRTRDSVTSVEVFSTQSPEMGIQEVITYTEVEVRVMTVVEGALLMEEEIRLQRFEWRAKLLSCKKKNSTTTLMCSSPWI
jgi:hypothetical protein